MSTKFAVPFLVLGLVAFGCSSSDTPTPGTGGRGGSSGSAGRGGTTGSAGGGGAGTTGTGGRGGTAGATAGTGGGTAGAGGRGGAAGATAGTGGGTAGAGGRGGAGGGTAGTGGGGGMNTAAQVEAMCSTAPLGMNGTGVFTAEDFCTLYLDTCTGANAAAGYTARASCEQMFGAVTTQAHCRSYHLCNAAGTGGPATHCPHATGMGLCN